MTRSVVKKTYKTAFRTTLKSTHLPLTRESLTDQVPPTSPIKQSKPIHKCILHKSQQKDFSISEQLVYCCTLLQMKQNNIKKLTFEICSFMAQKMIKRSPREVYLHHMANIKEYATLQQIILQFQTQNNHRLTIRSKDKFCKNYIATNQTQMTHNDEHKKELQFDFGEELQAKLFEAENEQNDDISFKDMELLLSWKNPEECSSGDSWNEEVDFLELEWDEQDFDASYEQDGQAVINSSVDQEFSKKQWMTNDQSCLGEQQNSSMMLTLQ